MTAETAIGLLTAKGTVPRTEEEKLNARAKRVADVVKGVAVAYVGLQLGLAAIRFIGRGLRGKKGPHARAAKPQRQQSAAAGAPHSPQAAAGEDSWTPVDAPPPATPDGYKPIVTAVLSCTPQELYGILFSSSGTELFLRQHREIGGQWDVVATAWRRAPTAAVSIGTAAGKDAEGSTASAAVAAADGSLLGPQSVFEWVLGKPGSGGATFTRLLTFWNPRKPPSSTDTRCVQRQQFCVYEGGMLLFATAMNMLDIPFKECFTVNSLWRTKPGARPGTTELTIHMKVHFVKRAMGVGGIISATTIRDSTSFYNAFIANVETHIKAIRQQAAAPLPKPLPVSAPVGGSVPGTPRRSRSAAAAAAAAGGIAPQAPTAAAAPAPVAGAHLRQPLPIWKQVRALLVFAVLAFTLLHQLHLGRELAALKGESGGGATAAGAAAGGVATAATTATTAAATAIGRDGLAGALVSSALGSLVAAAGSAHRGLLGALHRLGSGSGSGGRGL